MYTHSHKHTHSPTRQHFHTYTNTHIISSLCVSRSYSAMLAHTKTLSYTHTHTHIHTRTLAHTHRHTHTNSQTMHNTMHLQIAYVAESQTQRSQGSVLRWIKDVSQTAVSLSVFNNETDSRSFSRADFCIRTDSRSAHKIHKHPEITRHRYECNIQRFLLKLKLGTCCE